MGSRQSQHDQPPAGQKIGRMSFLGVLVLGILILIPGTRSLGVGMMILLAIPIPVGWVRARKLTDGSRGLTSVNAIACGLMVVVGAAMSPTTTSAPIPTETAAIAVPPQVAAPPIAPVPVLPAAPKAQPQSLAAAPQQAPTSAARPAKVVAPTKTAPSPEKATSQPPAAVCGGDHYTNSSGNCVHRPEAAPSAPSGATAKCKDGTYSFSQHRQGTCSRHGGVANWLG